MLNRNKKASPKAQEPQTREERIAAHVRTAYADVSARFESEIATIAAYFADDAADVKAGHYEAMIRRHSTGRSAESAFEKAVRKLRDPSTGYWRLLRQSIHSAVQRVNDEDEAARLKQEAAEKVKKDEADKRETRRQEAKRLKALRDEFPDEFEDAEGEA